MNTIARPIIVIASIVFLAAILPSCKKKSTTVKSVGGTWILSGSKDSSYSEHDKVKHISIPITKWQLTINDNYWVMNPTYYRNRKAAIFPTMAENHMPLTDSTGHGVLDTLQLTDSNAQAKNYALLVPGMTPTGKAISNAISASIFYDVQQDTIYLEYYWWLDVRASQANTITVSGKRK